MPACSARGTTPCTSISRKIKRSCVMAVWPWSWNLKSHFQIASTHLRHCARAASIQHHCAQLSHKLNTHPSYLIDLAKIACGTRGGGIHCFSKQELKFHPQKFCIKCTLKLVNFWYWKTVFCILVWQCFWRGREKAQRSKVTKTTPSIPRWLPNKGKKLQRKTQNKLPIL